MAIFTAEIEITSIPEAGENSEKRQWLLMGEYLCHLKMLSSLAPSP